MTRQPALPDDSLLHWRERLESRAAPRGFPAPGTRTDRIIVGKLSGNRSDDLTVKAGQARLGPARTTMAPSIISSLGDAAFRCRCGIAQGTQRS